ncbi:MAG: hypothetical protein ABIQ26_19935 [Streptosporangiaceae bacterium]
MISPSRTTGPGRAAGSGPNVTFQPVRASASPILRSSVNAGPAQGTRTAQVRSTTYTGPSSAPSSFTITAAYSPMCGSTTASEPWAFFDAATSARDDRSASFSTGLVGAAFTVRGSARVGAGR